MARRIRASEMKDLERDCEVTFLAWAESPAGAQVAQRRIDDVRLGLRLGMSGVIRRLLEGGYLDVDGPPPEEGGEL